MSNSFYKLFEKMQSMTEQDDLNNSSQKVMQPNVTNKSSGNMNDPNMQLGAKNNIMGKADSDISGMGDPSNMDDFPDEDNEDNEDNLSVPEGDVDIDSIVASLTNIKKMIPKFKTMDKDKSEQLDDLIKQTTNLVSSFSDENDEDSDGNDEELDDDLGDKDPSFNDEEGPPIKQTNGMEDMSKDMSSELPAINPPDQKQEQ